MRRRGSQWSTRVVPLTRIRPFEIRNTRPPFGDRVSDRTIAFTGRSGQSHSIVKPATSGRRFVGSLVRSGLFSRSLGSSLFLSRLLVGCWCRLAFGRSLASRRRLLFRGGLFLSGGFGLFL